MADMQLPPFTWKSALVYLIGVAAVLLIVYLLISALFHMTPRRTIPQTSSGAVIKPIALSSFTDRL